MKKLKRKKGKIMSWIYGFTPEILERGDLLPITKTHNSNIFLPTLVNNVQDLMC